MTRRAISRTWATRLAFAAFFAVLLAFLLVAHTLGHSGQSMTADERWIALGLVAAVLALLMPTWAVKIVAARFRRRTEPSCPSDGEASSRWPVDPDALDRSRPGAVE